VLVFIVGSDTIIAEHYFISGNLNIDVNRCVVIKNEKRIWFASFSKNLFTLNFQGVNFFFNSVFVFLLVIDWKN